MRSEGAGIANDASNLTPNPFPSGKGNQKGLSLSHRVITQDFAATIKPMLLIQSSGRNR